MRFLSDRLAPVRLFLVVLFGSGAAVFQDLIKIGNGSGQAVGSYSLRWMGLMAGVAVISLAALALMVVLCTPAAEKLVRRYELGVAGLRRLGILNWLAVAGIWVVFVVVVFDRFAFHFNHPAGRVWAFLLATGAGTVFALAPLKQMGSLKSFLLVAILYGVACKALSYAPEVSNFPFSMGWSEASRYYYASLPYSQRLFGVSSPLSFLHPSRYLLLGLAYWIPQAPIWVHRLWQVILWLGLSAAGGMTLARRLPRSERARLWVFTGFSMLYLLQGPVYYHLMISVILVVWGFDLNKPKKTLVFVILSSIWAGISRVNWFPVPAFLVITLYLLERPVSAERKLWRYLLPGVIWAVVGVVAAVASQAAYIPLSGNEDVSRFGSSFTADLLWYRLLPSPTYRMGVFPAGILVTAGLLILILVNWVRGRKDWHMLRVAGISLMMLVLLGGGLVVSTKIGGGSNIHNLDSYMVLVWIVASYIGFGGFASEQGQPSASAWRPWPVIAAIVAVALIWNLNLGSPFKRRDMAQAEYDLNKINQIVQQFSGQGQEILFINQRQLVVFNLVPGVKMVHDYELLTLMEMAMSGNQPYLDQFYTDLRNHRFALIVSERQQDFLRDPERDGFAEENNAWVEKISIPLLKYYRSDIFLDTQGIDFLVPR